MSFETIASMKVNGTHLVQINKSFVDIVEVDWENCRSHATKRNDFKFKFHFSSFSHFHILQNVHLYLCDMDDKIQFKAIQFR